MRYDSTPHQPRPSLRARLTQPLAVAAVLLLTACGGGGVQEEDASRPSTGTPRLARLIFPSTSCMTTQAMLTVRGAVDEPDTVIGVRVAGVAAVTTDGWQTWTAEMPLALGINDLVVESLATNTNTYVPTDQVRAERIAPFPMAPKDTVYSPPHETMYVLGERGGLVAQSVTGSRRVLGELPTATHLGADVVDGRLFAYMQTGEVRIAGINTRDGAVTPMARDGDGQGPDLPRTSLRAFDIHPYLNAAVLLYAVSGVGTTMWLVDLATGQRTDLGTINNSNTVSLRGMATTQLDSKVVLIGRSNSVARLFEFDTNTEVLVERPESLSPAVTGFGKRLAVRSVDAGRYDAVFARGGVAQEVYLLDHRASEAREIETPAPDGNLTSSYTLPMFFGADTGELIVHGERFPDVIRIDIADGSRTLVHAVTHRSGPLSRPGAIAYANRGLFVADTTRFAPTRDSHSIQSLSLDGDELTVVASNDKIEFQSATNGPEFGVISEIALTPQGIVFAGRSPTEPDDLLFDLQDTARTAWPDPSPRHLEARKGMCAGPDDTIFMNEGFSPLDEGYGIVQADRITGEQTFVNGSQLGPAEGIVDIAYDANTDTLYLCHAYGVRALDPSTGDSSIVLDAPIYLRHVMFSQQTSTLYVVSHQLPEDQTIQRVDLATGTATDVVDGNTHEFFPEDIHSIDIDPNGDVAYFTDSKWTQAIYSADLVTGECVLIAR